MLKDEQIVKNGIRLQPVGIRALGDIGEVAGARGLACRGGRHATVRFGGQTGCRVYLPWVTRPPECVTFGSTRPSAPIAAHVKCGPVWLLRPEKGLA
jgi:hypothetical protein